MGTKHVGNATLDRGDAHYGDAGGWAPACYHMGVFLRWAIARGLANAEHRSNRAELEHAPGAYVARTCDAKLTPDDFDDVAQPLIRRLYDRYLPHYSNVVVSATGRAYGVALDEGVVAELEAFLDTRLRVLRPRTASETAEAMVEAAPHRVTHPTFGAGTVVGPMPSGDAAKITVDFDDAGRKTMLARFVTLVE